MPPSALDTWIADHQPNTELKRKAKAKHLSVA
jgi:hypothetical protein